MTTANRDRSDTHALPMGENSGDSFDGSFGHPWTRGAKPQQEWRHEPSPRRPPMHYRIDDDPNVRDTIEARRHAQAQAQSCTLERR
jgi:hypothetical protein